MEQAQALVTHNSVELCQLKISQQQDELTSAYYQEQVLRHSLPDNFCCDLVSSFRIKGLNDVKM